MLSEKKTLAGRQEKDGCRCREKSFIKSVNKIQNSRQRRGQKQAANKTNMRQRPGVNTE